MILHSYDVDFSVTPHTLTDKSLFNVPIFNKLQSVHAFYNKMLLRLFSNTTVVLIKIGK